MDEIINRVRYLLGDTSQSMSDIFTYGSSAVFTLSEPNVISVTDVYRNDVASGVTHTYSSTTKKVTISSSLTSGDTIQVDYTYYPNYSNTELTNHIQSTLVYLSIHNYYTFSYDSTDNSIYPDISDKEKNLIALVTSFLIEPNNQTIRLPDITVSPQDNMSMQDKINRVISAYKKDSHGLLELI